MRLQLRSRILHGTFAFMMIFGLITICGNLAAQISITGKVTDRIAGTPLSGAHISTQNNQLNAISDADGRFQLLPAKQGIVTIKVTFVGYKTFTGSMTISRDTTLLIQLDGSPLLGEEVNIIATRAHSKYPTAYSTISSKEIGSANLGKDIPTLIQGSPSIVVTSDAGNGVGYSSFSIRGTDLTRINVTLNSIPLNDAESQGVWFVDLPDLASSTENIQIQRGVGTSTNGAGAFGASVNILTSGLHQDPYGDLDISGGSFNTFKSTLRFGSGLLANKFSFDGRLSYIHADGYIDRAFSNLKSFYVSGGYFGRNTTIKLITFSGFERTYQAWKGVPKDSLTSNRTYNPAGEYVEEDGSVKYYDNQTDNYQQDHYQLLFSQGIMKNWNFNIALHYTRGRGYYENYEQGASFSAYGLADVTIGDSTITSTDLVNRKMMDNKFYGLTFSTNLTITDNLKLTLGGAWNRYNGDHFGKIIWAQYASNGDNNRNWYYNTGLKHDFNLYLKGNYQVMKKLNLFTDLQYRRVDYLMQGTVDDLRELDQHHLFNFFNPKGGLFFEFDKQNDFYFSAGVANREPSRNNYKDADPGNMPTFETLYDYELGHSLKIKHFALSTNLYYMAYHNQLVLTGEINNVGEAIMVNVPRSYRTGIELSATVDLLKKKIQWQVNATLSRNRIKDFTQYVDVYNQDWQFLGQDTVYLGVTDLSFSPSLLLGSILTVNPLPQLSFNLNSKYVGKQYIDNTSNDGRSLHGYFINGISVIYTLKTSLFEEIGFNLAINNLFNQQYESNAWVYPYYMAGVYNEYNGYFPQAMINFLVGISVHI